MSALGLMALTLVGYVIMYRLYGRFLGEKVFKLSSKAITPAVSLRDDVDFVPTEKKIIFGHHYTSIAGTGPIVGPAIAIIWGWLPALLWVFLGSIFMGAIHDLGPLVISMRNGGQSLSEFTQKYISKRCQFFLFAIIFFELLIVIAIFGLVISVIFNMYPASLFPVWFQIPIAMTLGFLIYKRKMKGTTLLSIAALILMYATMVIGHYFQYKMPTVFGIPPTGIWTIILLIYVSFASILPVNILLQPRDYINSHQLMVAMILLIAGTVVVTFTKGLPLVAPAVQLSPQGAPSLWPFLFITIACGAISGFHSLVSSGTTSKQIKSEKDALFVGMGSMLMEGVLAILVIVAVGAGTGLGFKGLTGFEAWSHHYASWTAAQGLGSKIEAFVMGSSNIITSLGIPQFFVTLLEYSI